MRVVEPHSTFETQQELMGAIGTVMGPSRWIVVDREQVAGFLTATRPPREHPVSSVGEFVPPLLLVSLSNRLLPELMAVTGAQLGVNYGAGRIRYPEPMELGDGIRASAVLTDVHEVPGGVETHLDLTLESAATERPVCAIESIGRYLDWRLNEV